MMANPYRNNDRAAAFVDYYASDHMLASSVDRLYSGGIAQQQRARLAAAREAYPECYQAPVRRSQAEIDNYLQGRVETELLRRQQRRASLQRELYPETEAPVQYITKKELDSQIRRLYSESVRQRKLRERELERVFGKDKCENELVLGPRSPQELTKLKKLETQWRPPSVSVPYEDDNKVTLSSQYDYYANPQKFSELYVVSRQKRPMTAKEKAAQTKRLTDLSRPLSVTPRTVGEKDPHDLPPFRVLRKINYNDA